MNGMFAKGLLNSFMDHQEKERTRREGNTRDAINFLVSTGRVRDYNDLMPLVDSLFSGPATGVFMKKGGSGVGPKSGGKGEPDPHSILARFLNPAFQMEQENKASQGQPSQTVGGQDRPFFSASPSGGGSATGQATTPGTTVPPVGPASSAAVSAPTGAPPIASTPTPSAQLSISGAPPAAAPAAKPRGPLMTNEEMQARADDALRRKNSIEWESDQKKLALQHTNRLEEIKAAGQNRRGSDLSQLMQTKQAAFEQENGRPPTAAEDAQLMVDARAEWQAAGRKVSDPEAYVKSWLADAKVSAGGDLTPAQEKIERLKARKAWAKAGETDSGADKLNRAMALAKYRNDLDAFSPQDLQSLSQSVTIGDKTTGYLDISGFSSRGEKAQAMIQARQLGLVPVTAKQAETLASAQSASKNLAGFLAQIESKLPRDASGRPITGATNKLQQVFQTDEDLASAAAWDVTVLPTLRTLASGGLGHITNKELDLVMKSRPKLTDTIGTAQRNVEITQRILQNAIDPIVQRGEVTAPAGGGSTTPAPAPGGARPSTTGPAKKLDLKSPAARTKARQYLISKGKQADDATIDLLLSKPGIETALAAAP